jgi:transposase
VPEVSKNSQTGKTIEYSLKRWAALTHFLDDGRLCMSNNAAERELRTVAVRPAGSSRLHAHRHSQAQRRDPRAWLADVLTRMLDYPAKRIGDLLPWNWYAERRVAA